MAEARKSGNPGNFAEDRERAARAGHIGGQHSSGNFANNRERAAEAGRKGGQASHGRNHIRDGEKVPEPPNARDGIAESNLGNFVEKREKSVAAGPKGGQSSY